MDYVTLTHERNRRLTTAVRDRMARERLKQVTDKVIRRVLDEPVERGFFVSVDHILVMDRRRREGKLPELTPMIAEMWVEIFSLFDSFLASHPGETRTNAAIHVVSRGRASRFYISPANALKIVKNAKP